MNGHVGGRFELVAPRAVTDTGDRWRLLVLVLISTAIHTWIIANTAVTAKDSIRFARHALALWKPNQEKPTDAPSRTFPDVLRNEEDPPGYPLALAAFYFPVKAFWDDPHSTVMDRVLLGGQLASGLAGILMIFPMYWLGRMLFNKGVGFWATAIFQCLPVYARESSDAISDSVYLFFVASALLFAARGIRLPTVGRFLMAGLAVGMAYLVRPEGLFLVFPSLALTMLSQWWLKGWTRTQTAAWLTALAVGTAIPCAPYVAIIGRITNKSTAKELIDTTPAPPMPKKIPGVGAAVAGPPFASWVAADLTGAPRVAVSCWEVSKEWLKASHYSVGILSLLGIVVFRNRIRSEPALWLFVVFGGATAATLFVLAEFKSYVSERHAIPLVMVSVYFAVAVLEPLFAWAARNALFWNGLFHWPYLTPVVCLAIMLSGGRQLLRPLHDNRLGHKLAGEALRDKFDKSTDTLVDPYGWVKFYSRWAVFNAGPDDPKESEQNVRWAVVELVLNKDGELEPDLPKLPGEDLKRHSMAANIFLNNEFKDRVPQPTVERVFTWPDPSSGERARVVVVKQVLKPNAK